MALPISSLIGGLYVHPGALVRDWYFDFDVVLTLLSL